MTNLNTIKYIITGVFAVMLLAAGVFVSTANAYSYVGGQCTTYVPVCGQKMVCPTCVTYPCTSCYLTQQTYSNVCMLNQDSAQLLYYGVCGSNTGGSTTTNQAPTISSFSGPTSLKVAETGTWTIQASDPEDNYLTYTVDWGDSPTYAYASLSYVPPVAFTQTTTLQHSYTQTGTYTVTITVKDGTGNTVSSSATVVVNQQYVQPQPYPTYPTYPYYNYNNYSYPNYYQYQQPYYYDYNNYNYGGYYDNYYYSQDYYQPYYQDQYQYQSQYQYQDYQNQWDYGWDDWYWSY